jgi:hypothetical protein
MDPKIHVTLTKLPAESPTVTRVNLLAELSNWASGESARLWEEEISLHINPKPTWMPEELWRRMVQMVLRQEVRRGP